MYFLNMAIHDVLGLALSHCQIRNKSSTVFYTEKWPGGMEGFNLVVINRGSASFRIGDYHFNAHKEQAVLWAPGDMREFRPLHGLPVSFYIIVFEALTRGGKITRTQDLDLPVHFQVSRPGRVRSLFKTLFTVYNGKNPFRDQESSRRGLQLLRLLWESQVKPDRVLSDVGSFIDKRIMETLQFIAVNYKARLNVADLARRVHIHPVHFARMFKQATGMAPRKYILEKKIEKAKDFLGLLGQDPIGTSMDLGFYDYSHFYRTFRQFTGKSPKAYIRQFRKE
jgi:AraC-like DNA-binding protein